MFYKTTGTSGRAFLGLRYAVLSFGLSLLGGVPYTVFASPLPTAPDTYHLKYELKCTSAQTPAKESLGSMDVAERGGKLLLSIDTEGSPRHLFLYDGEKSLIIRGADTGYIYPGFSYSSFQLKMYFPFNFNAHTLVAPKLTPPSSHLPANEVPNVLVEGILPDESRMAGAVFRPVPTKDPGDVTFTICPVSAPLMTEEFSAFTNWNGFRVPGQISLTHYRQHGQRGKYWSTPVETYVFKLV